MRANKINILFVEDDPLIREGLSEFVSARFFNSVAVGDGLRALQILAEQPIDVIVTDIVLPGGLSGVELATRAKAMFPKVPVIFMTGYLSTVRAAEMPGLVLYKPVGAKELEAAIRRSLRN